MRKNRFFHQIISDFRSYLNLPLAYEWLKVDELFYDPFLFTRKLGINTLIEEINEGFNDESFINSNLEVKQSAIIEWVKLNNLKSCYFDSLIADSNGYTKASILEMKLPGKIDDVCKAMVFFIKDFEKKNSRTPKCQELWSILKVSNLDKWGLEFSQNKIIKSSGIPTDHEALAEMNNRISKIEGNVTS